MNGVVNTRIDALIDSLLPNGAGNLTDLRLRMALEQIAQVAWAEGRAAALLSLRSTEEAAQAWGVSRQRSLAHIVRLHQRWGVGMRTGRAWIVTQEEIDAHPPAAQYRRKPAGEA